MFDSTVWRIAAVALAKQEYSRLRAAQYAEYTQVNNQYKQYEDSEKDRKSRLLEEANRSRLDQKMEKGEDFARSERVGTDHSTLQLPAGNSTFERFKHRDGGISQQVKT